MFRLVKVQDIVAIQPTKLQIKSDIKKIILESIREKYENKYVQEFGYIIAVLDVKISSLGIIMPATGYIYNEVEFELLSWFPENKEVIEAEVSDVKEFGAFLKIGPIEGLVHISQILDDIVSFDKRGNKIFAKKTKRILEKHDDVRARVISVSYVPTSSIFRLAFTMRQPFLGKNEWIKENIEKIIKKK